MNESLPPAQYTTEQTEKINLLKFISEHASDDKIAIYYLEMCNWSVEEAVNLIYTLNDQQNPSNDNNNNNLNPFPLYQNQQNEIPPFNNPNNPYDDIDQDNYNFNDDRENLLSNHRNPNFNPDAYQRTSDNLNSINQRPTLNNDQKRYARILEEKNNKQPT